MSAGQYAYYTFSLKAGQGVNFELGFASGTWCLNIYDNAWNKVGGTCSSSSPLKQSYTSSGGGVYYVEVGPSSCPYSSCTAALRWSKTKGWFEPDEGTANSNPMLIYGAGAFCGVEGTLATQGGSHWYRFDSPSNPYWGGYYSFIASIKGSSGTDYDLYIYDSNGQQIASAEAGSYPDFVYVKPGSSSYVLVKVYAYSAGGAQNEYNLQVSRPQITNYALSSTTVKPGGSITLTYEIYNPFRHNIQVVIGCSIETTIDSSKKVFHLIASTNQLTLSPGIQRYSVTVSVPKDAFVGKTYTLILSLWPDSNYDQAFDVKYYSNALTVNVPQNPEITYAAASPSSLQPGGTTTFTVKWIFYNLCPAGCVVKANAFGDWAKTQELCKVYDGVDGNYGNEQSKSCTVTLPTTISAGRHYIRVGFCYSYSFATSYDALAGCTYKDIPIDVLANVCFYPIPSGSGTITFNNKVYSGGQCELYQVGTYNAIANPSSGWVFDSWSTGVASKIYIYNPSSSTTQVDVGGDGNLIAKFAALVTFYTDPANTGSITVSGSGKGTGTYYHGGQGAFDKISCTNCYTVTANPPSGYTFAGWRTTGSVSVSDSLQQTTGLVVNGPGTITAIFTQQSYSVTFCTSGLPSGVTWGVTVGGSRRTSSQQCLTVSGLTGQQSYAYDSEVATSDTKYACSSGCSGTVSSSTTVTATYAVRQYLLTISSSAGGTTNPAPGSYWYDRGVSVQVTATPSSGYVFDHWELDGQVAGTSTSITVTMDKPHNLVAVFKQQVTPTVNVIVVVSGLDGRIYYRTCLTGCSYIRLASGSTPDAPAAVYVGGKLYIAVRGGDGSVYFGRVDSIGSSSVVWQKLSGSTPSRPALATDGSKIYLVVRGGDNRIYVNVYDTASGTWSGWKPLKSGSTVKGPAAAYMGGKLHLVVVGADGKSIYYGQADPSTLSVTWTPISGSTDVEPSLATDGSRLYLSVKGLDYRVYVRVWSGSWSGWERVPTGSTPSSPAATYWSNNLYLIVRGGDSSIYYTRRLGANSYDAWKQLGGSTLNAPSATPGP